MGKKYLVDSNILIQFQANLLPVAAQNFVSSVVDTEFNISVISQIEVLGHHSVTNDVEQFLALANVMELNQPIAKAAIGLRKHNKIKPPDAIIAATAIVNGFTLLTRNISDFKKIDGLELIDPWDFG